MSPIDYLVIGHVSQDVTPDGLTLGGTATYASRTAQAFGCRVGLVTSAAPDLTWDPALAGIEVVRLPAPATSTFENVYTPNGRRQVLHARANPLDLSAVPPAWRSPKIVHLGPLADECDPHLIEGFPNSLIGLTPQGWMRRWDEGGNVSLDPWTGAARWLPQVDAAVISREDVRDDRALVADWARWTPTLVVTDGPQGCTVYAEGRQRHVPVTPRPSVDPTGAGDIFAAAFFVRLHQTGDPWQAARVANAVAALSVGRGGWSATPSPREVERALQQV